MVHVHRSKDNLWELALSFRGVGTGTNTVPQAWKQAPLPSQLSQPPPNDCSPVNLTGSGTT